MKKLTVGIITTFALCLTITGTSFATDDVGKGVKGDAIAVGVVNGNAAAVAAGMNATAENAVGAIGKDARVGGDAIAVGVVSGNAAAVSAGLGTKAENKVGTIAE